MSYDLDLTPAQVNLKLYKESTAVINLEVLDSLNDPYDITDCSLVLTIKYNGTSIAEIDGVITDSVNGLATFTISDWLSINSGLYVYDVFITLADSSKVALFAGLCDVQSNKGGE